MGNMFVGAMLPRCTIARGQMHRHVCILTVESSYELDRFFMHLQQGGASCMNCMI